MARVVMVVVGMVAGKVVARVVEMVVVMDVVEMEEEVMDIVLMENQQLDVFRGDYGNFEAVREERRARQERLHEAQMEKREHLQEYITKHGQLGSNGPSAAAQRKSRQKKMERINMEVASKIEGRKLQVSYDGQNQDEVTAVEEK